MGYTSYVTGRLEVRPRLPDKMIDELGLGEESYTDLIAYNGGDEDTVGLVNGEIKVIPGNSWTRLEPRHEDRYKAYDLPEYFDQVVTAILKAGHTVAGAIYAEGEESPDFTRYRVENGVPICERPEFLWPNGDKGWGV